MSARDAALLAFAFFLVVLGSLVALYGLPSFQFGSGLTKHVKMTVKYAPGLSDTNLTLSASEEDAIQRVFDVHAATIKAGIVEVGAGHHPSQKMAGVPGGPYVTHNVRMKLKNGGSVVGKQARCLRNTLVAQISEAITSSLDKFKRAYGGSYPPKNVTFFVN